MNEANSGRKPVTVWRGGAAGLMLALAGCATTPGSAPAPASGSAASPAPASASTSAAGAIELARPGACAALAGHVFPAAVIGLPGGLPSGAARIDTALLVPAATDAAPPLPEYCRLLGAIAPLGAGADPIRFQINLPTRWNRKAVMVGGGGFNGSLVTGLTPLRDAAPGQPHPLAQGFATFGTDSGHDAAGYVATDPAKFALNDEMFLNFAGSVAT